MQYGFVIDNRKCIGCHACTVACKSEHDVPVGVNRTWVKQTEKGEFPNTRRVFSVLRCNHCEDAPCVDICPTEALFIREDGIVDFDNRRCIGCKSCMQACPYDALYIDPETKTAAKCNYCAHRVDIGLEPACVNVCPEHAIISGDLDNPNTEIAQLVAREQVTVRKAEKGTKPNVFYIDGDEASLNPSSTEPSKQYIWSSQSAGVGHFSKFAEQLSAGKDLLELAREQQQTKNGTPGGLAQDDPRQQKLGQRASHTKRVYDTPDKGVLWGWEVAGYVWTKAIAAGITIVASIAALWMGTGMVGMMPIAITLTAMFFLVATTVLLVMDLDQPKRFLYVLLRPQWGSWLVRGGYALSIFGGILTLVIVAYSLEWKSVAIAALYASAAVGLVVAIYTAFLFAQAKGRDFWQSPALALHMLVHSVMAGAGALAILAYFFTENGLWASRMGLILIIACGINLLVMLVELGMPHSTKDIKRTVHMIVSGRYKLPFWLGVVALGNLIPILLCLFGSWQVVPIASVLVLFGIYITETIWVEAPQRVPLT
jgi:Fe-S-cluster-containing dehydrogenase component/formate-dependent nitrite reductase membrane component NrfD